MAYRQSKNNLRSQAELTSYSYPLYVVMSFYYSEIENSKIYTIIKVISVMRQINGANSNQSASVHGSYLKGDYKVHSEKDNLLA